MKLYSWRRESIKRYFIPSIIRERTSTRQFLTCSGLRETFSNILSNLSLLQRTRNVEMYQIRNKSSQRQPLWKQMRRQWLRSELDVRTEVGQCKDLSRIPIGYRKSWKLFYQILTFDAWFFIRRACHCLSDSFNKSHAMRLAMWHWRTQEDSEKRSEVCLGKQVTNCSTVFCLWV